jgi:hypothetical protein
MVRRKRPPPVYVPSGSAAGISRFERSEKRRFRHSRLNSPQTLEFLQ